MIKSPFFSFLMFILLVTGGNSNAQTGIFDSTIDIGNPKMKGSAFYDEVTKEYTLRGGGYNIWFERDEFRFLYKTLKGDFTVTADFELIGEGTEPHRKTGWMIRESLNDSAAHISGVLHGDGLTVMQWREVKGSKMRDPEDEIFSDQKGTYTIQLIRRGDIYTMKAGVKNGKLITIGSHSMPGAPAKVLVGVFVCSHNNGVIEEVRVKNVTIN